MNRAQSDQKKLGEKKGQTGFQTLFLKIYIKFAMQLFILSEVMNVDEK